MTAMPETGLRPGQLPGEAPAGSEVGLSKELERQLHSPGNVPCECVHLGDGDEELPCGHASRWRATMICKEPGCDCAVSVYTLCDCCRDTWELKAYGPAEYRAL